MARRYVSRAKRSRVNIIETITLNSMAHKITELATPQEKRELIEQCNPLLYIFGTQLTPQTYEDLYANDHSTN